MDVDVLSELPADLLGEGAVGDVFFFVCVGGAVGAIGSAQSIMSLLTCVRFFFGSCIPRLQLFCTKSSYISLARCLLSCVVFAWYCLHVRGPSVADVCRPVSGRKRHP